MGNSPTDQRSALVTLTDGNSSSGLLSLSRMSVSCRGRWSGVDFISASFAARCFGLLGLLGGRAYPDRSSLRAASLTQGSQNDGNSLSGLLPLGTTSVDWRGRRSGVTGISASTFRCLGLLWLGLLGRGPLPDSGQSSLKTASLCDAWRCLGLLGLLACRGLIRGLASAARLMIFGSSCGIT